MDAQRFEEAASLRGQSFLNNLNSYKTLHNSMEGSSGEINTGRNLAVVREDGEADMFNNICGS